MSVAFGKLYELSLVPWAHFARQLTQNALQTRLPTIYAGNKDLHIDMV